MSDKFKALLENELLSDDVKEDLKEAVEAYKKTIEESVRDNLEVEFAKKFERDKTDITKKLYGVINESVDEEIKELKDDIEYFRGLEVKYAKKMEDFKKEYAKELSENFETTVKNAVSEEIAELHEEINEAKQSRFGAQLFEAFKNEFVRFGFADDMKDVMSELEETRSQLEESQKKIEKLHRERILESLLSNLSGSKKNVMKTILENVATEKLESRYDEALPSVLEDSNGEEKKDDSMNESKENDEKIIHEGRRTSEYDDELRRLRELSRL